MNKFILFVFFFLLLTPHVSCANQILPHSFGYLPDSAYKTREFLHYKQKYYALYFNILELDNTQSIEFENILKKYDKIYNNYTDILIKETEKYKTGINNNLPFEKIYKEKKEIKNIYKMLKQISKNETNELKEILNKSQKQKYKLLKHLEIHDLKKEMHPKNYYKSNPRMNKFGNPKK